MVTVANARNCWLTFQMFSFSKQACGPLNFLAGKGPARFLTGMQPARFLTGMQLARFLVSMWLASVS